jgi:hypothetical protein
MNFHRHEHEHAEPKKYGRRRSSVCHGASGIICVAIA